MILEVAILNVKPTQVSQFEQSFAQAEAIISSMHGYLSHELRRCVEISNRYLLLVSWETLEDHTKGFRESDQYAEWSALLHHYYDPFPQVEHYEAILNNGK